MTQNIDTAISRSPKGEALKPYVQRIVEAVPFVAGVDPQEIDRAQAHMMLAFSGAASPELAKCSKASVAHCIVLSALSGLMPGGPNPDVWIIPRRNSGNWEANWQMAARGYVRLARRGRYDLDPVLVFEGDEFRVTRGTSPKIIHEPAVDLVPSWGTLRCGYVVVTAPDGRTKFALVRKSEIQARRKMAQTDKVWAKWPLEMALKTLCNYAGQREMFPCDDPSRYAIEADTKAQIGEQPHLAQVVPPALPATLAPLDGAALMEPAAADTNSAKPEPAPPPAPEPVQLKKEQVARLVQRAGAKGVAWEDVGVEFQINSEDIATAPYAEIKVWIDDQGAGIHRNDQGGSNDA